jgi:5'-nucleotidase
MIQRELREMKILVTNDDGIDADGIAALTEVAREFGDVTVVAPRRHHSGCSHQMTFEGHLDAHQLTDGRFWVDGFPADCSRIGLAHLCPEVDLVVSGINHGGNLGLDNYLSGTVAAAREATFFDKPAIAFSQYHRGLGPQIWQRASVMAHRVFEYLLDGKIRTGCYWNVNFPLPHGEVNPASVAIVECPLDRTPLPNDYTPNERGYTYDGDYHARKYKPDTDVDVCMKGNISLTLVCG